MWFEQIQQSFLDLPPATGRDADIVKGVFTVTVGEAVILQEDVAYDLSTRACRGPSSMFEILKNSPYDISLKFLDDDDNASAEVTATLTATDTLPPNAPTGFGATANIGEREVADAPPTEPTEPAPEPPADGT